MPPEPIDPSRTGQWWTRSDHVHVPVEPLRRFCQAALRIAGMSEEDAAFVVECQLEKDLQKDHVRGLADIPRFVTLFQTGELLPRAEMKVVRDYRATALLDGGKSFSRLACAEAMRLCIAKAREYGVGFVGLKRRSTIPGSLGPYMEMAVREGMLGIVTAHAFPAVAPAGGAKPLLGNSPIAFGIPAGQGRPPVILDMALTQSSASPVFAAAREGRRVPEGIILDEDGNPTTDPLAFAAPGAIHKGKIVARGSLVPIGGYKGYGLIVALGVMSSFLIGADPSWDIAYDLGPRRGSAGITFMAFNIGALVGLEAFEAGMGGLVEKLHSAQVRPGEKRVYYPGERSYEEREKQAASGLVPLPSEAYAALRDLGSRLGIPEGLPEPVRA